jgi:CheY-like chemotaxis protein
VKTTVKRFLVADDEAPVRLPLEKIRQSAGYRVTSVADGMAALKAAREDPLDLAVCDLSMPGIDGFTVCSMLKRNKMFRAPILVLRACQQERYPGCAQGRGRRVHLEAGRTREAADDGCGVTSYRRETSS